MNKFVSFLFKPVLSGFDLLCWIALLNLASISLWFLALAIPLLFASSAIEESKWEVTPKD